MLIVKVRDGEGIEKALKRMKRKVSDTKLIPQLRKRQEFIKPSIKRREEVKKAIYIERLRRIEGER